MIYRLCEEFSKKVLIKGQFVCYLIFLLVCYLNSILHATCLLALTTFQPVLGPRNWTAYRTGWHWIPRTSTELVAKRFCFLYLLGNSSKNSTNEVSIPSQNASVLSLQSLTSTLTSYNIFSHQGSV